VSFTSATGTIDVATLVVHLDGNGRPARLPDWFGPLYAAAAQGRTLNSRLVLPGPPADSAWRPWPVRSTDLDVMGHVNNAVTWAAIEDECARRGVRPAAVTVEWSGALEGSDDIGLRSTPTGVWLVVDGAVRVAAALVPA
jgi:acyl-ACP thioesterase